MRWKRPCTSFTEFIEHPRHLDPFISTQFVLIYFNIVYIKKILYQIFLNYFCLATNNYDRESRKKTSVLYITFLFALSDPDLCLSLCIVLNPLLADLLSRVLNGFQATGMAKGYY